MFGWLFKKRGIKEIKESTKKGFDDVKKDINSVSGWIRHLDSEKNLVQKEIIEIKGDLSSVKKEIEGIKNVLSFLGEMKINKRSRLSKQLSNKQTGVYAVQTAVETAVQTPNFDHFSITERAILWILLNTDLRLSYEDLAAMLGKEKSTIRSQINSIKQKSEGLVEEIIEKNGRKRVFIPEEMKEKLLKKSKVRVERLKKDKKKGKNIDLNY